MNLTQGESKGITSAEMLFFPVGVLQRLDKNKSILLKFRCFSLRAATWTVSMKNLQLSEESFTCGFHLFRHNIGAEVSHASLFVETHTHTHTRGQEEDCFLVLLLFVVG